MKLQFSKDAMPFAAMAMVEIGEVGLITLGKAAMSSGMSNFVYVVYSNALGTVILLHYFIYSTYRFFFSLRSLNFLFSFSLILVTFFSYYWIKRVFFFFLFVYVCRSKNGTSLTVSFLCKFFLLGLLG